MTSSQVYKKKVITNRVTNLKKYYCQPVNFEAALFFLCITHNINISFLSDTNLIAKGIEDISLDQRFQCQKIIAQIGEPVSIICKGGNICLKNECCKIALLNLTVLSTLIGYKPLF